MAAIDFRPVQKHLGLAADGIAGPNTWRSLFRTVATFSGADPDQSIINGLATAAMVHLPAYGLTDTVDRLSDILAQTANETGGFTRFEENLNYSVAGMLKTWSNHFTVELAGWAKGSPERVAEVAYGVKSKKGVGRMGNTSPGDGYLYRGRGMLQLTGRGNYAETDKRLGIGLVEHPELAAIPALSLLIACEFYQRNKVLTAIDAKDFTEARRITNGGSIGLDHVNKLRKQITALLS